MKTVIIAGVVNTCISHGLERLAFSLDMAVNDDGLNMVW